MDFKSQGNERWRLEIRMSSADCHSQSSLRAVVLDCQIPSLPVSVRQAIILLYCKYYDLAKGKFGQDSDYISVVGKVNF